MAARLVLALLILVAWVPLGALSAEAATACVDAEPNNALAQAVTMPLGASCTGMFKTGTGSGGDVDWYKVRVINPGVLTVTLSPPKGGGNWTTYQPRTFAPAIEVTKAGLGYSIRQAMGTSPTRAVTVQLGLGSNQVPVDLYVQIGVKGAWCIGCTPAWLTKPDGPWSDQTYTLKASMSSFSSAALSGEPTNDSMAGATALGFAKPATGYMLRPARADATDFRTDFSGDSDWYKVTVPGPGTLKLSVKPPIGGGTFSQTGQDYGMLLALHSRDTNFLATGIGKGKSPVNLNLIVGSIDAPVDYYLSVSSYGSVGDTLGSWSDRPYLLSASFTATPGLFAGEGANDTASGTTQRLPLGQKREGYFLAAGRSFSRDSLAPQFPSDQDWYALNDVGPGTLAVTISPPSGGGNWATWNERHFSVGAELVDASTPWSSLVVAYGDNPSSTVTLAYPLAKKTSLRLRVAPLAFYDWGRSWLSGAWSDKPYSVLARLGTASSQARK